MEEAFRSDRRRKRLRFLIKFLGMGGSVTGAEAVDNLIDDTPSNLLDDDGANLQDDDM